MFQALSLKPGARLIPVLRAEIYHVLAFIGAMFTLSAIREYFGAGALWGIPLPAPYKLGGVSVPFMGFILLGFFIAFLRCFNRRLMAFMINEHYKHRFRFEVRGINE